VASKHFHYGQKVHKGDILLELQTSELENKLREARSKHIKALQEYKKLKNWERSTEMAKARRSLDKAKYDLKRSISKMEENEVLFEQGIIPKTELNQSRDDVRNQRQAVRSAQEELNSVREKGSPENVAVARMDLQNAESQLAILEEKLSQSCIRAPVEGIVIRPSGEDKKEGKTIEVGAPLAEGDILLAVGNLEGMTVDAKVDEVDISKIALGQQVKVTGDAFPGVTLKGRIEHISSQAKSGGGSQAATFDVVVTIEHLPEGIQDDIRLGMSANLRIVVYENPTALMVPIRAVRSLGGKHTVRVVEPGEDAPREVTVTTGLTTLDSVEITSGLSAGDKVVVPGGRR
jgi:RND family efflux transporter MFP subunit